MPVTLSNLSRGVNFLSHKRKLITHAFCIVPLRPHGNGPMLLTNIWSQPKYFRYTGDAAHRLPSHLSKRIIAKIISSGL